MPISRLTSSIPARLPISDVPRMDAVRLEGESRSDFIRAAIGALIATRSGDDPWRETVRDIYDKMHFGPDSCFTGNPIASHIIQFIEDRHRDYFATPFEGAPNGSGNV